MEFLPNLRLMSRSVCCICSSASPCGESLEPPSAERIASHSAASAEAESTGTSIAANKSRLRIFGRGRLPPFLKLLVGQHIGGDHIHPTDQQTPVDNRKESLSTASQIRDVADVGSGNAIDPVAGLGTRRPYLSIETGPVVCCHGMFGNRLQISGNILAKPFRIEACRVVADHQSHSAGFHALRYQINDSVSAISRTISRAASNPAGPVSTCPELKLCPAGL